MDISKHPRTSRIQRLSKYLYWVLSAIHYPLYLCGALIVVVAFVPQGDLELGDAIIDIANISLSTKLFILFLYALGLISMLRITYCFRELMRHYLRGNIFSSEAIKHVRGALFGGLFFFAISLVQHFTGALLSVNGFEIFNLSNASEIFITLIFFGLMLTLLWALEIGEDLNEESQKTI